jgi:hypothetical protein
VENDQIACTAVTLQYYTEREHIRILLWSKRRQGAMTVWATLLHCYEHSTKRELGCCVQRPALVAAAGVVFGGPT